MKNFEMSKSKLVELLHAAEDFSRKHYGVTDDNEIIAEYLLSHGVKVEERIQQVYKIGAVHQCKYDLFEECSDDCMVCRYHSMQEAVISENYEPLRHDKEMGQSVFWTYKEASQKLKEKNK